MLIYLKFLNYTSHFDIIEEGILNLNLDFKF